MKTPAPRKSETSALVTVGTVTKFSGTDNPRHLRVIAAALRRSLPREQVDREAGCSNGPELVAELRRRGLEFPCVRIEAIDRDGKPCKPGVYNNGHLQASFKWCKRFGIGSEHTLRDSIAQLISHGLIYRTRSHGANGAWAKYAVTWLPIKNRDGLFLAGFLSCAWREWQPSEKKTSQQKVQEQSGRKCSFNPKHPAESAGSRGAKTADYELIPCSGVKAPLFRAATNNAHRQFDHSKSPRPMLTSGRGNLRLAA